MCCSIYIYSRGLSFLLEKNRHTSDLLKMCCTMIDEECSGNLMRKLREHVSIIIHFLNAFYYCTSTSSSRALKFQCHFLNLHLRLALLLRKFKVDYIYGINYRLKGTHLMKSWAK